MLLVVETIIGPVLNYGIIDMQKNYCIITQIIIEVNGFRQNQQRGLLLW